MKVVHMWFALIVRAVFVAVVTAVLQSSVTVGCYTNAGRRGLLFVRDTGIWLRNQNDGRVRKIVTCGELPIWLGSQHEVGFARYGNVYTKNLDTGSTVQLTKFNKGKYVDSAVQSMAWDPIGHAIVFSRVSEFVGHLGHSSTVHRYATTSIYWLPIKANHVYMAIGPWEQGAVFAFSSQCGATFSAGGTVMLFIRNGDIWLAARGDKRSASGWNGWQWDVSRLAAVASFDDPNWHGSRDNEGALTAALSPDNKYIAYIVARLGGSGVSKLYIAKVVRDSDGDIVGIDKYKICPAISNACSISWDPRDNRRLYFGTNIDGHDIYQYDCLTEQSRLLVRNGSNPSS